MASRSGCGLSGTSEAGCEITAPRGAVRSVAELLSRAAKIVTAYVDRVTVIGAYIDAAGGRHSTHYRTRQGREAEHGV